MKPTTRSEAIAQGLKTYFTGKPCKHGHIAERILPSCNCIVCSRESAIKSHYAMTTEQKEKKRARAKVYSQENKEKISAYYKIYRESNKDKESQRGKEWYEANKKRVAERMAEYSTQNHEKIKELRRKYFQENKTRIYEQKKKYNSEYRKKRYAEDPRWKAAFRIRAMLARVLGQTSQAKWAKSEEMVGYTRHDLIAHLSGLLSDGMTWGNFGKWHIDHIKPISLFIKEGITDPSVINALSNLQPLWAEDNFKKSAKYEE